MRFWIFLRLAIKDAAAGIGYALGIAAILCGALAALVAFFGAGCDRVDNQESMQTTQQEGGR